MALVEIRKVRKRFGPLEVLAGVSLDVDAGEVVCLLGASGCGKTTLLRCINNLETIDEGSLLVDGKAVGDRASSERGPPLADSDRVAAAKRAEIGMVFQRFNLFPHLTVLRNLCVAPIHVRRLRPEIAEARAVELLRTVGLEDKAGHYPNQLSGGQQQRVAIVRALAMDPKLMLFDEPTSALDPELVGEVLEAIRALVTGGMTMIIVTHELAFARDVADRIVMMHAGVVVEDAPPATFFVEPAHDRSRAFLSRMGSSR